MASSTHPAAWSTAISSGEILGDSRFTLDTKRKSSLHAPYQLLASQQVRRNCGVILRSKRAVVMVGSERRNQLPNSGSDRPLASHDGLGKLSQVEGGVRMEAEQMPDLRILGAARPRHADQIGHR